MTVEEAWNNLLPEKRVIALSMMGVASQKAKRLRNEKWGKLPGGIRKLFERVWFVKNPRRPVSPWAVCTASVGRKNKAKYERCVRAVKARMGMKNPSISAVWPAMKDRQRFAALQFAGVPENVAKYHAILEWSDLPAESKSALLKGWNMGEIGRTTRRYRDTTRRMPVLTNPASAEFKRQVLRLFSPEEGSKRTRDIAHQIFGKYPSDKDQRAVAKALEELARTGALHGELHSEYDYTQVRGGHFGASKIAMKRRRWRWYLPDANHPPGLFDMTKGGSARKNPTEGWAVTQDGETLKQFGPGVKGANAAFAWLHKRQGNSVDWAVQYSGYDMVNVEGGKVVYSYKQKGLRRLTNRRNGTKGAYPFKAKADQYRAATIAELLFARRDAAQAAKAMKGHDPAAENWYMDDYYTISDEITRRRHSLPNKGKGMAKSLKNAAAGASKVVEAFLAGRKAREGSRPDYKAGARYETDGTNLIQWGSIIARKVNGSIEITDAGWRTKTTMAMLNAVLYRAAMNVQLYQKSHQWFLSTSDGAKPWTGKAVIKLEGGSVLANRKGRAAKMRTRQRRAAQRKGRFYVSTYEVTQEYGGPEEGGWWYSRGFPTGVYRQFRTREEANSYAMKLEMGRKERAHKLQQEWKAKGYRGWSKVGEDDIKIIVQQHPPRRFPEYRPHYENNPKRSHRNPAGDQFVLGSNAMIYAPGVVKWIMAGYRTSSGKQKKMFSTLLGQTWHLPQKIAFAVTTGKIPFKIEGETVVVTVPGKGKKSRLNPLTRTEAASVLKLGRLALEYARSKPLKSEARAYWRGRAVGAIRAVEYHGPTSAHRASDKLSDRVDKARSLPNPISCLKNLHTARERDYAKKLIERYWQSGKAALIAGNVKKAAHAYGAIAALRRLARFESPPAQTVWNLASWRLDLLKQSARDFARMRKGGR